MKTHTKNNAAKVNSKPNKLFRLLDESDFAGDYNSGWLVARNPFKILNHLALLRQKEVIATHLNLHNINTDQQIFTSNMDLLRSHQQKIIPTETVINILSRQTNIPISVIRRKLAQYATIAHMELHPTDNCNLQCEGCTYKHDIEEKSPPPISYPFERLVDIKQLNPKSILLIGGGEPTLYRYGNKRFGDLLKFIRDTFSGSDIALVSNGTYNPLNQTELRLFKWIRFSIDASTEYTYKKLKGSDHFDTTIRNWINCLKNTRVPVGIGFLYSSENIHESAEIVNLVYSLLRSDPDLLERSNVQFRPIMFDAKGEEGLQKLYSVSNAQVAKEFEKINTLIKRSPKLKQFVRDRTNFETLINGNTPSKHIISRCYYSQIFRIVRADGDVRPCFVRVNEPEFSLGNILRDPVESISINEIFVAAHSVDFCNANGCRQGKLNSILESGLANKTSPLVSKEAVNDVMF